VCAAGSPPEDTVGAPSDTTCFPARVGRRRGATLESAIFDAVLEQMCTVGFSGLTMEGVAAAAHTGKAALYRRWQSKADLVADALDQLLPSFDVPPDSGSTRDDLAEVFTRLADTMNSPVGGAMQSLFSELERDPEFFQLLQSRVLGPRKVMMLAVLQRGVQRGEVRPEAVNSIVAEAGPALLVHRLLTYGPPVERAYIYAVLDEVVMPLLRPQPAR
jgi:AcrR family transcriptional regulator